MEEVGDRANDVLRSHHSTLTKLIVSAGLRDVSDECESKELITSSLKDRVLSNSIGKTESDRASILLDEVRKSLGFEPHETMDDFLCILFNTGGRKGKLMAEQLAKEYGFPLTNLNKAIESEIESHRKAMSTPRGSVGVASKSPSLPYPNVEELKDKFCHLKNLELFVRCLPNNDTITDEDIHLVLTGSIGSTIVYAKWLEGYPDATWDDVITALKAAGEKYEAKYLEWVKYPYLKSRVKHSDAFKQAVESKGSFSYSIVQCMPFGLPRAGKTSLYYRLLNKVPPGERTTPTTPGFGSPSTDVLTEQKMIQANVNLDKVYPVSKNSCTVEKDHWKEVGSPDEEMMIFLEALRQEHYHSTYTATMERTILSHSPPFDPDTVPTIPAPFDRYYLAQPPRNPYDSIRTRSDSGSSLRVHSNGGSNTCSSVELLDSNEGEPVQGPSTTDTNATTVTLDDSFLDTLMGQLKDKPEDPSIIRNVFDKSLTIFYTDCGGQPEFQEVLPALAAGPTIFILLFSLFEGLESLHCIRYESEKQKNYEYHSTCTVKDVLMQCLSSILSFHESQLKSYEQTQKVSQGQDVTRTLTAPPTKVLVVGTHKDLVDPLKIGKIDRALRNSISDSDMVEKGIIEYCDWWNLIIPIDNFSEEDGRVLRQVIERIVRKGDIDGKSPFKVEIPAPWLGLELYLRRLPSSVVSHQKCIEIGAKLGISEDDLDSCLWFLHHQMGTIRYYKDVDELKDTIIIAPRVIFKAVTKLIFFTFTLDEVNIAIVSKFHLYSLFKVQDVENVFNQHKQDLQITFRQFIALLEHLNIIGPAHHKDFDYFLPCALAHAPPPSKDTLGLNKCDPLLVSFKSKFIPKGVFSGMLACLCKDNGWDIRCDGDTGTPLLFRDQATLVANGYPVTIRAKVNYLEFFVHKEFISGKSVSKVMTRVLRELDKAIYLVLSTLRYSNEFKYGFYCTLMSCSHLELHFAERMSTCCKCSHTKLMFNLESERQCWFDQEMTEVSSPTLPSIEQLTNATIAIEDLYTRVKTQPIIQPNDYEEQSSPEQSYTPPFESYTPPTGGLHLIYPPNYIPPSQIPYAYPSEIGPLLDPPPPPALELYPTLPPGFDSSGQHITEGPQPHTHSIVQPNTQSNIPLEQSDSHTSEQSSMSFPVLPPGFDAFGHCRTEGPKSHTHSIVQPHTQPNIPLVSHTSEQFSTLPILPPGFEEYGRCLIEQPRTIVQPHTHSIQPHTQSVQPHTQSMQSHTQSIQPHTQSVQPHTQSVQPHTHVYQSVMSPRAQSTHTQTIIQPRAQSNLHPHVQSTSFQTSYQQFHSPFNIRSPYEQPHTQANVEPIPGHTANDIWRKKPSEFDAFKLVKAKSAEWNMFAIALEVSENDRACFNLSGGQASDKLNKVINYWLESYCSPPTFKNLHEVVLGLKWQAEVEGIEEFVANPKNIAKYKGKKDY